MVHLPDQRHAAAKGNGGEQIENAGEYCIALPRPPGAAPIASDDDGKD
jgi:hypothetical protein